MSSRYSQMPLDSRPCSWDPTHLDGKICGTGCDRCRIRFRLASRPGLVTVGGPTGRHGDGGNGRPLVLPLLLLSSFYLWHSPKPVVSAYSSYLPSKLWPTHGVHIHISPRTCRWLTPVWVGLKFLKEKVWLVTAQLIDCYGIHTVARGAIPREEYRSGRDLQRVSIPCIKCT